MRTAARWIEQAKRELSNATERALAERLKVPITEAHSMLTLVLSRTDTSLRRLLGGEDAS